jgi:dihydrofolate reductase
LKISIIVAMDRNRLIGRDNRLPWHLSADLKHFKQVTLGKPIVMGRKTHESIGKPLADRTNIVITGNPAYPAPGCVVVQSLPAAIDAAHDADEIMIIGGARLYEQAMPLAHRIYLTEVQGDFAGDTWFPLIDWNEWEEKQRLAHEADDKNPYPYAFVLLERRVSCNE